jgi:S1 RNA binding domain protein
MQLEVGKIVEGKVTGITKFGAFIELSSGEVGMVHISEIAPTYVSDIADHLQIGQTVHVKILAINEDGKISLSIKKAMAPTKKDGQETFKPQGKRSVPNNRTAPSNSGFQQRSSAPAKSSFEDMLSKFMQSSDEKISDMKRSREISRRSGQKRSSR